MNYITSNITSIHEALNISVGTFPSHVFCISFFVPISSLLVSIMAATSKASCRIKSYAEIIVINLILLIVLNEPFCNFSFLLLLSVMPILCTALLSVLVQAPRNLYHYISKIMHETQSLDNFNRKFIGDYRGHLLLATSICILAVDFAMFPVWFSKTETYGWSVMDAGVGSFVFVHGLCSTDARRITDIQARFKKCMLSSLPLFILGVIRLTVTKAVGYHTVVPEYGLHWNFFFTLAYTKLLCYIISTCFFFIPPGLLAIIILINHQTLLSKGLTELIVSDFRRNIFEANKEGICSLFGFVSLQLFGVQMGQLVWKKRNKMADFVVLLVKLIGIGAFGWILMYFIHERVQPVSRRMVNASYCIWVVALTSLQIAIHLAHQIINFILGKILQKNLSESLLWKAINYNGLCYFLLANVLTGVVNLSIKTENYDVGLSFIILVLYLLFLHIPVIVLYKKSIQLKFW